MINCDKNECELKGKRTELFTEITLIFEHLIKSGCINDVEDVFVIFEAISKCLRNDFDGKEEK